MNFWKFSKDKAVVDRVLDEAMYEQAFMEMQSGHRREGIWAKAIVLGCGDKAKAEASYLRLLAQRIRDDSYIAERQRESKNILALSPQQTKMVAAEPDGPTCARMRQVAQIRVGTMSVDANKTLALCANLKNDDLNAMEYADLARAVGAAFRTKGLGWSFALDDWATTFKRWRSLRPWFLRNVVPVIGSTAQYGD